MWTRSWRRSARRPGRTRWLRCGRRGTVVISGATSGPNPPAALTRVFFHQLRIVGSTMGSRDELARLLRFCEVTGVRPVIDSVRSLVEAPEGFARMEAGDLVGKIVFAI